MKSTLSGLLFLLCASWLSLCFADSPANQKPQALIVRPCPSEAISHRPITDECVAAAIAENAFRQQTRHQVQHYVIISMPHTEELWKFVFELDDGTHPPPDGGQWFAYVNRSTGKVDLVPGR
jgi:hypothetical protein